MKPRCVNIAKSKELILIKFVIEPVTAFCVKMKRNANPNKQSQEKSVRITSTAKE